MIASRVAVKNGAVEVEEVKMLTKIEHFVDKEEEEVLPASPPTTSRIHSHDNTRWTTAVLCLAMLTHSYLLISVFPYSGFLVIHLRQDVSEDTAGMFAGIIASVFMLGRAATSVLWGKLADRYGRVRILSISLYLSAILSVLFGLARSFESAVALRFTMGLCNGVMVIIKTLVSETSSSETEAHNMSYVLGMWSWGFLVSPALSGALAEPTVQYPGLFGPSSMLASFLSEFPFVLPNLVAAVLCVISALLVKCIVAEPLPESERHSMWDDTKCLFGCKKASSHDRIKWSRKLSDVILQPQQSKESASISVTKILSNGIIRRYLMLEWMYGFVSLTVDEAFPLWCLSHTAGFGIPEKDIGKVLSACGLLFALCQFFVSNTFSRFGIHGSIVIGSLLSTPMVLFFPLALLLNWGTVGELRWSTFTFLAVILAVDKCFSLLFFSGISVATNRAVPSSHRASVNGLSVFGGSIGKAMGPALAGILTMSVGWLRQYASLFIFGVIGGLGLGVAAMTVIFLKGTTTQEASDSQEEIDSLLDASSIELGTTYRAPA